MTITIDNSIFLFLGVALVGWACGMGGSFIGMLLGLGTRRGEYKLVPLVAFGAAISTWQPVKIIVALAVTGIAMAFCATVGQAAVVACATCAVLGALFVFASGSGS